MAVPAPFGSRRYGGPRPGQALHVTSEAREIRPPLFPDEEHPPAADNQDPHVFTETPTYCQECLRPNTGTESANAIEVMN